MSTWMVMGIGLAVCLVGATIFGIRTFARLRLCNRTVAFVTHEIAGTLYNFTLNCQFLKVKLTESKALTPNIEKILQHLDKGVFRQKQILEMLQNSALAWNKRSFVKKVPCNVSEILATVVEQLEDNAKASDTLIIKHIEPDVTALVDARKFEHIATNLITNAIKYSEKKPVYVTLDADKSLKLKVMDRGNGIRQDDTRKIFRRYERLNEKQKPGLGLGLWITKSLVELHGGKIDVQSRVGAGSIFTVDLPLK